MGHFFLLGLNPKSSSPQQKLLTGIQDVESALSEPSRSEKLVFKRKTQICSFEGNPKVKPKKPPHAAGQKETCIAFVIQGTKEEQSS